MHIFLFSQSYSQKTYVPVVNDYGVSIVNIYAHTMSVGYDYANTVSA